MSNRTLSFITLAALLATPLLACSAQRAEQNDLAQPPQVVAKPGADKSGNKSPGKPGAPVNVKYSLNGKPAVGVPLDIELTLEPRTALEKFDVEYGVEEGLTLQNPQTRLQVRQQKAGEPLSHVVQVIPQGEGLFYVKLTIRTVSAGGLERAKVQLIPVSVGHGQRKQAPPPGELTTDAEGRPIISMPAKQDNGG